MEAVLLDIDGIVQGVGFRPFLYNLAMEHGLKGWILNRGNAGVRLHVEGEPGQINRFINAIHERKPPSSRVDRIIEQHAGPPQGFQTLAIRQSEDASGPTIVLPADIATCQDCIGELFLPGRYHQYPFIACANCGPRFTTVVDLPYDRERTTMIDFPMDIPCDKEYHDPANRRFHAQTFSCPDCGPNYYLINHDGHVLSRENDALKQCTRFLKSGKVIAMKGIGGVHVVVDATSDAAVDRLRGHKGDRKFKPFAVMVQDIEMAREHTCLSLDEEVWLLSHRRPIILARKAAGSSIPPSVAPGLERIGIMLPYMGTHHLLFHHGRDMGLGPIVVTSGNKSGLPMAITNEHIKQHLSDVADYFLMHDRRIHQRCDDSVAKVVNGDFFLIRRSRGFVPEYIPSPVDTGDRVIVAVGSELHATGAILKGNKLFFTQYIGDVVNLETLDYLKQAIGHLARLLRVKPSEIAGIACDAHPLFFSTTLAEELSNEYNAKLIQVYHHHAHCASIVLDNLLTHEEPIVHVTLDGVGYGIDGAAWGGEIFAGPLLALKRAGHLAYKNMPGGDAAVKHPARMLASILHGTVDASELPALLKERFIDGFPRGEQEIRVVLGQLASRDTLPVTSSMGRVLDAMSVLLGCCTEATYEGEPAIRLEGLASKPGGTSEELIDAYLSEFTTRTEESMLVIDLARGFHVALDMIRDRGSQQRRSEHARAFLIATGRFLGNVASDIATRENVNMISLSGGVALNDFILPAMKSTVHARGLRFLNNKSIPPGDGGISAGQAFYAALRLDVEK